MLTQEQLIEIKKFNQNVDWLMKNQGQSVPNESSSEQWVSVDEAMRIVNRSRSWIGKRLLKGDEIDSSMNVNWYLVRGIDWEREGNKLVFKRASMERLKSEIRSMGKVYEENLARS